MKLLKFSPFVEMAKNQPVVYIPLSFPLYMSYLLGFAYFSVLYIVHFNSQFTFTVRGLVALTKAKKKGKRKVQGVPQSHTAALSRHQEEEETDKTKQAQIDQTYHCLLRPVCPNTYGKCGIS